MSYGEGLGIIPGSEHVVNNKLNNADTSVIVYSIYRKIDAAGPKAGLITAIFIVLGTRINTQVKTVFHQFGEYVARPRPITLNLPISLSLYILVRVRPLP